MALFTEKHIAAIDVILHDGLTQYRTKHSCATAEEKASAKKHERYHNNKKGSVAVIRGKANLATMHGLVVTSKESLYNLVDDGYTHFTPNQFNYLKYSDSKRTSIVGHEKKNLQQINTFVVDIDSKVNEVADIILACHDTVGAPTLILETDKGYHVYLVLAEPFYISNKDDYRTLAIADRIAENIKAALSNQGIVGIDRCCNNFGVFRLPTATNMVYFQANHTYELGALIQWSMKQTDDIEYPLYGRPGNMNSGAIEQAWYAQLVALKDMEADHGVLARNSWTFTVALANYASNVPEREALQQALKNNAALSTPLKKREVKRCVQSAYSGKYQGPDMRIVKELIETWGHAAMTVASGRVFVKHAQKREDRTYSHMNEWEADVIAYVNDQEAEGGYVQLTLEALCQGTGIPRATLKKLLKTSKKLRMKRIGKGRATKTFITTIQLQVQYVLQSVKDAHQDIVGAIKKALTRFNLPWQTMKHQAIQLLNEYIAKRSGGTYATAPPN